MEEELARILDLYAVKCSEISGRLDDFKRVWEGSEEKVFEELCFCLLTPQSKALHADRVIRKLLEEKLLYEGDEASMKKHMNYIRFHHTKARHITLARKQFLERGKVKIKGKIDGNNPHEMREWLVKNVKGLGYKEASHFLRNVGLGEDMAILDRHILRNLAELGVIKRMPKTLTRKQYLDMEERMKQFCKGVGIKPSELDLLLWCKETGFVFK